MNPSWAWSSHITHNHTHQNDRRRIVEKGVIFAGLGAIVMAIVNFTTGVASQATSPVLVIWFVHTSLALICAAYLAIQGELPSLLADLRSYPATITVLSILDNIAWISYASAMTLIPIAIATTISESYIVLASLLGVIVNREHLKTYQWIGIIIAIIGILLLSATTDS